MVRRFLCRDVVCWGLMCPGAVALAALLLVAGAPDFAAAGAGEKQSEETWTPPRRFTLVYNINNAGYIDVCGCKHKEVRQGSITRRASFLKQFRSTGREILLVDGGSSLFPIRDRIKDEQRDEAIRKASLIVEAYNRMGYRAMAVGAFDLAAGLDTLKGLEKKAKFSLLSANLVDKESGKLLFKPYEIVTVSGIRVGLFGLTLETLSKPFREKHLPSADILDPLEAARGVVEDLKGKCDLVVALSHVREETSFEIAKELESLEVLIDPYIQYQNHHTWIKEHEWQTFQGDTLFLRSDGQGARLGAVDIEMQAPRRTFADQYYVQELRELIEAGEATPEQKAEFAELNKKNSFAFTRVSIEPHHLTDPEMDLLIEEWKRDIDPSKVASLETALPQKDEYLTAAKCAGCHEKQNEFWLGTKHAKAIDSLIATSDQHRFDCIGCHSLGYGQAFLDTRKIGAYANVQCESCHGVNPKHAEDPAAHAFAKIEKEACLVCHNEAQTLKDFNFFATRRQVACPKS